MLYKAKASAGFFLFFSFFFLSVNDFVIHNYSFGFCPCCINVARIAACSFYSIKEAGHPVHVSTGKISR
jgi:hypothetical protein